MKKNTLAFQTRTGEKKTTHTEREPKVNLHQTDSISFANRCTFRLPLATAKRVQCGKTLRNFIYAPAIFDSLKTFSIFVFEKKRTDLVKHTVFFVHSQKTKS